jgi:hypothetical protein
MNANRMREYFRAQGRRRPERKPPKWLVGTDLVLRTEAAVAGLLRVDGGWWSPSCVLSRAAILPNINMLLARCLVRAALAKLARGGRVEVGSAGPGFEPLFRWSR